MQGFKSSGVAAIAIVASLAVSPAAYGFDKTGNPIADTLLQNIEASGAKDVTAGSVTGDSGRTEITDLKATVTDDGKTANLSIGSIVFEDGAVEGGRLKAEKVTVESLTVEGGPELRVSFGKGFADKVVMPTAEEVRANPTSVKAQAAYHHAEFSEIVFTTENGGTVPVESVVLDLDEFRDGRPHSGAASVTGITVNKAVLDGDGQQAFEQFGYEAVTLSFSSMGSWDQDAGVVTIEEIKISGDNVGTLLITGQFGGLTKEIVDQLENNKDPEQAMQLLQGVSIHGLSIRIDNDSIVERALDAQAKQMGVDRDAFAEQIAQTAPLFLSALQNKAFEAEVAAVVGTFLRERKSIMAVAQPAQPIPAAQIIGAAMVAPQTLPSVLAVKVSNP